MSLSKLSATEVEEYLENYKWHREAYDETVYQRGPGVFDSGKYVKTGKVIPERWVSIAEDDVSWMEWEEALSSWSGDNPFVDVEGLGRVTLEHQHGGEGEGDDYYIILRIEGDGVTRYFKKNGYHASHDGSYLDGSLDEVKPVVKPVTFYE